MTGQPAVLVVGSINVDLVVHTERLPGPGETVAGGRFERGGGGKGANQAVAAARAGAAVALVGAVGDDDLGAEALAELRAAAVDVAAVRRLARVATGVALIVVAGDGDNQIAVASGANHELAAADVRAPAAAPGCVLASFELRDEPVLAAGRLARDAGCPLIVNPAPARPLPEELCALRPIVVPNRSEAAQLSGAENPEEAAARLRARTGAPVAITLGERGALVADDDGTLLVPAPRVAVVDTTGAGDAFCGALAAALAGGAELRRAAADAVAAASRAVTVAGARGAG
jgi:ribokinase